MLPISFELFERAHIKQQFNALPCGKLPLLVLSRYPHLPAAK
jgi:hypothetical protein